MYYVSVQNTPTTSPPSTGRSSGWTSTRGDVTTFVGKGNGLRNPRGLAFVGNFLVVTDTDRVWKISQAGR